MKHLLLILLSATLIAGTFSKTAEEWKSRVIYEIMTDRFGKTGDDDNTPCTDLGQYCGGTFKGIEKNLDYIQGLGVNAIWISPIQEASPGAYHGYWVTNFYKINPNFGTEQDFKDLVKACHERDIWVMVDVVPNHIGFVQDIDHREDVDNNDYSNVVPFNDPSHFHKFEIECHDAERRFPENQTMLETCWLFHLPDLNQENPWVRKTLLEWVTWLVKTYDLDGLRLDALRHISKEFWAEFSQAAGVYTVGEVWSSKISYAGQYQKYVDSVLNFPFQEKLMDSFAKEKPMTLISEYYKEAYKVWPNIDILANFLDCHDLPRFLSDGNDVPSYKAAISFIITSVGVPILYYGGEQGFTGADDPANRESLWPHMSTDTHLYQFIKTLTEFRKESKFYEHDQIERFADDTFYAFSRGKYFFAYTNSMETRAREIEDHPYKEDTWLCNAFDKEDCVQVKGGKFTVAIAKKDSKVLYPKVNEDENKSMASKVWMDIKNAIGTAFTTATSSMK